MKASEYAAQLPAIQARYLVLLAQSGQEQESTWYKDWGNVLRAVSDASGITFHQACALFAALSPRKNLARNWRMFLQALGDVDSVKEATRPTRATCRLVLADRVNPFGHLHGPKTHAFALALAGDDTSIAVDTLMYQAALGARIGSKNIPRGMLAVIKQAVQAVARLFQWSNAATQAAIWEAWRKGKPTLQGHSKAGDPNPILLLAAFPRITQL